MRRITRNPRVMVVDDTPENLKLLDELLRKRGYDVRTFPSGALALRAADKSPPDLILLDIMMPDMDGFEVCRRLKDHQTLRSIPVLFISAIHDSLEKVRALDVGGVDFISKPFFVEEVEARVRTHLTLRETEQQLQQKCEQLTQLERSRDQLVQFMVHDMRSPLTVLLGAIDLLEMQNAPSAQQDIEFARSATEKLLAMTNDLLDVSRAENGQIPLKIGKYDVAKQLRDTARALHRVDCGCMLEMDGVSEPLCARCDPEITRRVIENLVANGLRNTPDGKTLHLAARVESNRQIRVLVRDEGPGIAPEVKSKLFDKFGRLEQAKMPSGAQYSSGLGLTFCKLAVQAQGGHIGVDSEIGKGACFWFTLPR